MAQSVVGQPEVLACRGLGPSPPCTHLCWLPQPQGHPHSHPDTPWGPRTEETLMRPSNLKPLECPEVRPDHHQRPDVANQRQPRVRAVSTHRARAKAVTPCARTGAMALSGAARLAAHGRLPTTGGQVICPGKSNPCFALADPGVPTLSSNPEGVVEVPLGTSMGPLAPCPGHACRRNAEAACHRHGCGPVLGRRTFPSGKLRGVSGVWTQGPQAGHARRCGCRARLCLPNP